MLIVTQRLRSVAVKEDICGNEEQVKATDELMVSGPSWVMERVSIDRGNITTSKQFCECRVKQDNFSKLIKLILFLRNQFPRYISKKMRNV